MRNSVLTWFAVGAVALFASGCVEPEYGHLEITQQSSPPSGSGSAKVSVSNSRIELPVGAALLIKALPVSGNDQAYTSEDSLSIVSSSPSIFGVFHTGSGTRVVLTGAHVGDACLSVNVNGREVECVPVRVIPQF
jgi:hypothetical protein